MQFFKFLDKEHQRTAIIPLLDEHTTRIIHECRVCRYRMRLHEKDVVVRNLCERTMIGNEYMELHNISTVPKECIYLVKNDA